MPKNYGIYIIRNIETNELWKTPKGKSTWTSIGAAKNSWHCHTSQEYITKYGNNRTRQIIWKENNGYVIESLGSFKFEATKPL